MILFERSSLEERLQTKRNVEADASAHFIHSLATNGMPISLAAVRAAAVAADGMRRGAIFVRRESGRSPLGATTPTRPCAPAV